MNTFMGFEFLDIEPNRVNGASVGDLLSQRILDPGTGDRSVVIPSLELRETRSYEFLCFGREDESALRAFVERRYGMSVPFWIPTWQRDLGLLSWNFYVDGSAWVTRVPSGYATDVFPHRAARRFFALLCPRGIEPGDGVYPLSVTRADARTGFDVIEWAWERQVPEGELPECTESWSLSQLLLVRLASDSVQYEWDGSVCTVKLEVVELPGEVPK